MGLQRVIWIVTPAKAGAIPPRAESGPPFSFFAGGAQSGGIGLLRPFLHRPGIFKGLVRSLIVRESNLPVLSLIGERL